METQPQTNHGFGLASLILGSLSSGLTLLILLLALTTNETTPEDAPIFVVIGLFTIGMAITSLTGLGLGIASLLQKNRKKTLGIIGLVLSASSFLLVIIPTTIGLLMLKQ